MRRIRIRIDSSLIDILNNKLGTSDRGAITVLASCEVQVGNETYFKLTDVFFDYVGAIRKNRGE